LDKRQIIEFFDSCASSWDETLEINDAVIKEILFKGGVSEGKHILDVASGTGVLFPYYNSLGADFTGIDISPEMVKIAREKFPENEIICGDAESYAFEKQFDAVMIHNAFPHFPDGDKLISNLTSALKNEGRISVAHSISAKELEKCHSGAANKISLPLPSKEKLGEMMGKYVSVDFLISDDRMFMVSGVKK